MDRVLQPFARLLPHAEELGDRRRRAAALAAGVLLLTLAAHLAYTALGIGAGSETVDAIVNRWGRQLVMAAAVALCALRVVRDDPDRTAWLALTIGLGLWALGNTYWNAFLYTLEEPPFPSPADAGWLAFYPFAYLCLGLHVRRTLRLPSGMWLDGLVGVLAADGAGLPHRASDARGRARGVAGRRRLLPTSRRRRRRACAARGRPPRGRARCRTSLTAPTRT